MRFGDALRCLLPLAVGASTGACGRTADQAAADAGVDAPVLDAGTDASLPDAVADAASDPACDLAAAAISPLLNQGYCTTLLRVSSVDLSVLGWSIGCGPLAIATEADARKVFSPYAGAYSPIDTYQRVGPTGPTDDFVFHRSPGDFGGLGIVSLATSQLVFAGELDWSALGKVLYPAPVAFRPPSELPAVCAPRAFTSVSSVVPGVGAAEPAKLADVLLAVERTPVQRAIERAGHALADTLVVFFQVDGAPMTGPPKDEWLVVMDSSLLE